MSYIKPFWYRLSFDETEMQINHNAIEISESEYLELIRKDLVALLSHLRRPQLFYPRQLSAYGLIDLTLFDPLSEHDREVVRQAIQVTIEQFEPRLKQVLVTHVHMDAEQVDYMQFKIYATVLLIPNRKTIMFDSKVATTDGNVSIEYNEGIES